MLQVWGKIWYKNQIYQSHTATDEHADWTEALRLESCIDEIIHALDLPRPIWLAQNHQEMQRFRQTKFHQDHFIEHFPYQSFEIEIVRTDEDDEE